MSFFQNGGLFVPKPRPCRLGDEVLLSPTLMGQPETLPLARRVALITPDCAPGNRQAGIGIEWSDEGVTTTKIENYLAGSLTFERVTHTH